MRRSALVVPGLAITAVLLATSLLTPVAPAAQPTATDRHDNSPADALTAEKVSAPFPVAHVPPAVTLKVVGQDGDRTVLEATATDPYVRLTEAQFAVDGKRWTNVFPVDGLFDGKAETFRFPTDALTPGTHVVVLRVRDAAGNVGAADVVIEAKK